MIWTEKMDAKYSRRTKEIYMRSTKWNLMGRGFVALALIVGVITRPVFAHPNWVVLGIVGALFLGALACLGMVGFHLVRFLRSCAEDRRRRKAGLPLDGPEAAQAKANQ